MLVLLAGARSGGTPTPTAFTAPTSTYGPNTIPIGIGAVSDPAVAFFGLTGRAFRRVDIHNADGSPWYLDAPVIDGSISVDLNRDERRTLELTLDSDGNTFRSDATAFWYDKIVKVYRGVTDDEGNTQSYPLGEFLIDQISEPHFPHQVRITGRDFTKRLMLAKFPEATAFVEGNTLEAVIGAIAANGGITQRNFPITGIALTREFFFEAGKPRWEAMKELAEAHGYELFFDPVGTLIMRLFVDPTTAPVQFTFFTGDEGNMASYELVTSDTRIFNDVLVTGSNSTSIPVYGHAENTEPSSPTRIAQLGRRTYVYDSKFIDTTDQAQALAVSLLKVMALESYELSLDALVAPWLEAGVAVEFLDPDPAPLAPTRFLLTGFTIPLVLGTMNCSANRVTIVS